MSEEQFGEWKQHPLTIEFMNMLRKSRMDLLELMADGKFVHERADTTAIDTAETIGECRALKRVIEMSYEDYIMELEENDGTVESKRPSAPRTSGTD